MLRRTFHTLGKMAPVGGRGHGTDEMMRARSECSSRIRNQPRSGGIDGGKAAACSRLNHYKKFPGAFPCLVEHGFSGGLRQLSQRVRNHYQVMLFAGQTGAQILLEPL